MILIKRLFLEACNEKNKIITLILSLAILISTNVVAFADYNQDIIALSQAMGISKEDVVQAKETLTDEEFRMLYNQLVSSMNSKPVSARASYYYSDGQWRAFKASLVDGAILITSDSFTLGFQHGHAAIISGITGSSSDPLTKTYYSTEHKGKDYISGRYVLTNNTGEWWRTRSGVGVYHYANNGAVSQSTMNKAKAVAMSSLVIGKPYNSIAAKYSTNEYNCSTLVFQCYNASGADIGGASTITVLPVDIARDNNASKKFTLGYYGW